MSLMVNAVLAGVALVLSTIPLLLTGRLKRRLPAMLRQRPGAAGRLPRASAILPCKGLDPGFRENMISLLEQDYPELELLFVVATIDDPAHGAIAMLLAERHGPPTAKLLVAGIGANRGQKLTNQLAALQQVSPESEVLVFVDSDCRPDPGFIRRLVAPLAESDVGATTGYRWYHPPRPTLGSMLRSTWNAGALPFLVDEKTTHAWGGAMAIRRDVFSQAQMEAIWDKAVSDDLTLTVAVRRLGKRLVFVPRCIAVSYEMSSVAETIEFTNRQSLISRIYFPPLWWGTALGHASANVLMFYGLVCSVAWARDGGLASAVGAACLMLLPLQLINAAWLFGSAKELLPPGIQMEVERLRWRYVTTAPLASILTLVNTLHSATTRRLTWRGVTYELRSENETVVLARDE